MSSVLFLSDEYRVYRKPGQIEHPRKGGRKRGRKTDKDKIPVTEPPWMAVKQYFINSQFIFYKLKYTTSNSMKLMGF